MGGTQQACKPEIPSVHGQPLLLLPCFARRAAGVPIQQRACSLLLPPLILRMTGVNGCTFGLAGLIAAMRSSTAALRAFVAQL